MLETIKDFSPITALKLAAFRQEMSDNYRNILNKKVFCETIITGKEGLRLRKTLANEEANTVFDVVWKESIYVSSKDIMEAGYDGKTFSGDIICYSLGLLFAEDKNKVSAAVARIRNIILAGCDYGLISRNRINSKNAPVRCERLLHDMMIELAACNSDAARQLNLQLGWDVSHLSQKLTASHNWRS